MMDELDLARRAVRRSLLSEEQLREAQSFASGGRSLLAVLLDLGYLRPQDIVDLTSARTPEPAGRSRWGTFFLLLLTVFVTAFFTKECSRSSKLEPWLRSESSVVTRDPRPVGQVLTERAQLILAQAEGELKRAGTLSAETDRRVQHAAALLTEAISDGDGDLANLSALARANEMLDRWEAAVEGYRRALAKDDRNDFANLGLARVLLLLNHPREAYDHATAASTGAFAGEALVVRAKASLNLGNKPDARADLDLALKRDPSLRTAVRALQTRLDE